MFSRILVSLVAGSSLLCADTLVFRNGATLEGSFVGGDNRSVRFLVGNRVNTYGVNDVATITFSGFGPTANAPSANTPPNGNAGAPYPPATYPPPGNASTSNYPAADGPYASQPANSPTSASTSGSTPGTNSGSTNGSNSDLNTVANAGPNGVAAPSNEGLEIPANSNVVVRLIDPVNSESDHTGQTYRATIDEPVIVNGQVAIPRGSDAVVALVASQQSGRIQGSTSLTLALRSITASGRTYDTTTAGVQQASEARGKKSAEVIGGTAALGAIIGALAGGGRGAAIGAVSGGAVGTGVQVATTGQKVKVPSETRLTFVLQNPIAL